MAKRATSAYIFFVKDKRASIAIENPDMKFTDISKEVGKQWKSLSEKNKAKYIKLAEADKERFLKDVEVYGKPSRKAKGEGKKGKKEKKEKKPHAKSAYIFFVQDKRASVVNENPEMKFTDISREMGKMWRAMGEKQKAKYVKLAEADKERVIALKKELEKEKKEEKEKEEEEEEEKEEEEE